MKIGGKSNVYRILFQFTSKTLKWLVFQCSWLPIISFVTLSAWRLLFVTLFMLEEGLSYNLRIGSGLKLQLILKKNKEAV